MKHLQRLWSFVKLQVKQRIQLQNLHLHGLWLVNFRRDTKVLVQYELQCNLVGFDASCLIAKFTPICALLHSEKNFCGKIQLYFDRTNVQLKSRFSHPLTSAPGVLFEEQRPHTDTVLAPSPVSPHMMARKKVTVCKNQSIAFHFLVSSGPSADRATEIQNHRSQFASEMRKQSNYRSSEATLVVSVPRAHGS